MRLIDADWVISVLNIFNDKEHGDEKFLLGIASAKEIVENAPTIDAEPVVKCKDCILDREAQCPMKYATEPDDYCSWGERMDEVNK